MSEWAIHSWSELVLLILVLAVLLWRSRRRRCSTARRAGRGNGLFSTSPRKGFVEICPGYRSLLRECGLTEPEDFLALAAVTVSGHPDRNVSHVVLGQGPGALPAFLKREHMVPWRARLNNMLAGFGWVSRSMRECRVLQALEREGLPCPDWLAAGEDSQGRAFLLLREHSGCIELRRRLRQQLQPPERRTLAELLGQTLANLHHKGFTHPDLYANHILLQPGGAGAHPTRPMLAGLESCPTGWSCSTGSEPGGASVSAGASVAGTWQLCTSPCPGSWRAPGTAAAACAPT